MRRPVGPALRHRSDYGMRRMWEVHPSHCFTQDPVERLELGFSLIEDTYIAAQDKRWVLVAPPGSTESRLLLARAVGEEQSSRIGNQTGGRVFLFLHTDDFWRDFNSYRSKGTVAVFKDIYGNLWDLLQLRSARGR